VGALFVSRGSMSVKDPRDGLTSGGVTDYEGVDMDRIAIRIESDPHRVTLHPDAVVEDLGPQSDGIHDYRIWCARTPADLCSMVRAALAEAAR
jgi:hypothetical protein